MLGLEHRYLSEKGSLNPGERKKLQVSSVKPGHGLINSALEASLTDFLPKNECLFFNILFKSPYNTRAFLSSYDMPYLSL